MKFLVKFWQKMVCFCLSKECCHYLVSFKLLLERSCLHRYIDWKAGWNYSISYGGVKSSLSFIISWDHEPPLPSFAIRYTCEKAQSRESQRRNSCKKNFTPLLRAKEQSLLTPNGIELKRVFNMIPLSLLDLSQLLLVEGSVWSI